MAISKEAFEAAALQSEKTRQGGYAVAARYEEQDARLVVDLNNGVTVLIPIHLLEEVATANPEDLREIEITPAGLGLHWPRLDADVYVPGMLQGAFGSKNWTASQLGAEGGRASTPAKAKASRENGQKGGRPRKMG